MSFQLHKIRGGTISDLRQKKYNIGVGASLGNKWFSTENTLNLIRWSLEHTKEYVVVYIADSIHAINLEVRNSAKKERAKRLADEKGLAWLNSIKHEITLAFSPEERARIFYARWKDFQDVAFVEKRDYLYECYRVNPVFRNRIEGIVRGFVSAENRIFDNEQINILGTYILEELPEMICRVSVNGRIYEANAYPFDSGITELAEDIQLGRAFPEIRRHILDTEPKVFLEVR